MKIKPGQIILFDIDKTLHSSDQFRKIFKSQVLQHLSLDEKKYDQLNESYRKTLPSNTYAHSKKLISHLSKELGISPNIFRRLHYSDKNYQDALFAEARGVLEELSKTNILGTFTEGYKDHQLRKLKKGGILHYFDPKFLFIFFNKRTPKVLNLLSKNAVVIDDNPEVIKLLLNRKDLTPIWLNRVDQTKHSKAFTIHSLEELLLLV